MLQIDETTVFLIACGMAGKEFQTDDVQRMLERLKVKVAMSMVYTRLNTLLREGKILYLRRVEKGVIGRPKIYQLTDDGRETIRQLRETMTIALRSTSDS